jgi:pimeloyl-ACP methyl ester carboxylesterase
VRRLVAAAVLAGSLLAGMPANANHQAGHLEPAGPAPARFPKTFPVIKDSEWGFRIGGFGGKLADDPAYSVKHAKTPEKHLPVIFVHGNTVDAADWYPVRDAFIASGWNADDLWAISYNGLGGQSGTDGTTNPRRDDEHLSNGDSDYIARVTANDVNVNDLYRFVLSVRTFRKQPRFTIVAHSLGVTVARKMLKVHPWLRRHVEVFVGIAGGNHGTSLCPDGSQGHLHSCDEIAKGTRWLANLNGLRGVDETWMGTRFLTVFDGSGTQDAAYIGPDYAKSPALRGALNCELPHHHNDLRIHPESIAFYRAFIEGAEVGRRARCP